MLDNSKIDEVTPLHEQSSESDLNNYGPILILSTLVKNIERLVHVTDTWTRIIYSVNASQVSGRGTPQALVLLNSYTSP